MLSTYFYARRIQEMEKEKQAAESARQEAEKGRQEEARLRREAEDEVRTLRIQLEQANASHRLNNQDTTERE